MGVVVPSVAVVERDLVVLVAQRVPRGATTREAIDGLQAVTEIPDSRRTSGRNAANDVVLLVGRVLVLVHKNDRVAPSEALGDGRRVLEERGGELLDPLEARVSKVDGVRNDGLLKLQVRRVSLDDFERERVDGLHPRLGALLGQAGLEHDSCGVRVGKQQHLLTGTEVSAESEGRADGLVGLATASRCLDDHDRLVAEDALARLLKFVARRHLPGARHRRQEGMSGPALR